MSETETQNLDEELDKLENWFRLRQQHCADAEGDDRRFFCTACAKYDEAIGAIRSLRTRCSLLESQRDELSGDTVLLVRAANDMRAEVESLRSQLDSARQALEKARARMDVLYDGHAVYRALSTNAKRRTSADNVADVLDAIACSIRTVKPMSVSGSVQNEEGEV